MTIPCGDFLLEAELDGKGERGVVICHPHPAFGGRMDTPLIASLARGFVDAGFSTLRFHFRGIEGSGGQATGGRVEHEDVLAAHRFLARPFTAWVGYSFGALMALRAMETVRPSAYVGIAIPTGILEGRDVPRVEVSGLLLAGDRDPLCDATKLAPLGLPVELLEGEAHAFSHVGTQRIVDRAVAFVRSAP